VITVTFNDHGFLERLPVLLSRVRNPSVLMARLGRATANNLKAHFRTKDKTPNRLGGKRTHYWRQVADSVQNPQVAEGGRTVSVSINHASIAQKLIGGEIRAKRVSFLTIPVSPDAHGRTALTFETETGLKLFFLKVGQGKTGNAVLATDRGLGIQIEYILTKSVNQDPDPTALPNMEALSVTLLSLAEKHLAQELAKATGKGGGA